MHLDRERFSSVAKWAAGLALWAAIAGSGPAARATGVSPAEMTEANNWVEARFGVKSPFAPEAALVVHSNNDPVQLNGRGGRPLRIAGKPYAHGLFCHAVSKVAVRLPAPGKRFTATVGVDSNEQTLPGRGSIVFSVRVGDREAFRSPLLREGMPGIPAAVDLAGAKEFVLEVGDAGDGIACDQAAWAEAQVALADGKTLRLGDLPALGLYARKHPAAPPFSFQYGGKPSSELLPAWEVKRQSRNLDDRRTEHVTTYADRASGLVVRCVAVAYRDFPTVEWTLHFKNTGKQNTPLLGDVQAADLRIERFPWPSTDQTEFHLHHQTGSPCRPDDYAPHAAVLKPRETKRLSAAGGRPTNSDLPYFNIELPTSEGVIVVVGWPGQWAAQFQRDEGAGLRVRAGQELARFTLHPGEEVRTPLVVLQFWKGDRVRAQNVWRRWMLAHNLPRPGGRLPPVQMAACSSHQFGEMIHGNTENQKFFIDRYLEEKLPLDYWWMDAGWYVNKTGWPNTGTWEVDTKRFPGGLRPICDHAHAKGVKTIVWFEPERVTAGTWLAEKHPEWVLGGLGGGLLNLGNPEARAWLTEHVDKLLTEQAIDLYRQDFNIDPLDFWRKNDAPDRQGITEIRYVEGYLAYWDELRRRHPNMLIDSCASGGRRNDLETLRRAVPLLRSDYIIEPVGNQAHTYGISFWIPYYGTGTGAADPYMLRSVMCPHFTACFDMRQKDIDYALIRRELAQWRRFAGNFVGDYYPLSAWSTDPAAWIAWQFDRPEAGEGMIQAFRRAESPYEACRFRLRGLDPAARYVIHDVDHPQATEQTGRKLMDDGLLVSIPRQPWAAVLTYKRQ